MGPSRFLLASVLAAGSVLPLAAQANPSPAPIAPDLFIPRDDVRDPFLGRWAKIKRSQPVHVDINLLNQSVKGEVFRLKVLDKVYYARLDRKESISAIAGAYHWHCTLLGYENVQFSSCILTVVGDGFAAGIHPQMGAYGLVVQGAPGMHCVREMGSGGKGSSIPNYVPTRTVPRAPESACDDPPARISVLMLYDATSRSQAGGTSKIQAAIANALAQTNLVWRNSGLGASQLFASSIRYANYTGVSSMPVELDRLTYLKGSKDPTGQLDFVHQVRANERADLVTLFLGDVMVHGNIAGRAWRPANASQLHAGSGFSVTEWNSSNAPTRNTFAHELGHNFGCAHDPANAPATVIQPNAYGWRPRVNQANFPTCTRTYIHTMMCYEITDCGKGCSIFNSAYSCRWLYAPIFSNPNVTLKHSWGTIAGGTATANNANVIWNTRHNIANYGWDVAGWRRAPRITSQPRSLTVCLGYQTSRPQFTVGQTGGTKYRWLKDGKAIPFAVNAVYQLPQTITAAHAGLYRCRVSGPCYTTYSSTVRLTVSSGCRTGRITKAQGGSGFGNPVVALGDFDGDGYKDIGIGMPGATISGRTNTGCIHIRSGKDFSSLSGGGWIGNQVNQYLGRSLAAGDIDGDGKPDLIAGADGYNLGSGAIYWGSSKDKLMRTFRVGAARERLGSRVASAQYLDRDGVHDILASAGSRLYAFSGRTRTQLWSQVCASPINAIANLGDLNRDGFDDIGVGCPDYNGRRGMLEVRSGRNGGLIRFFAGGTAGERLGYSVAGLGGDITGDGVPDYIASSPWHSSIRGVMSWWNGATGAWLGNVAGSAAGRRLGWQVAGGGDYNNDGFPDALVTGIPTKNSQGGYYQIIDGKTRRNVLRTITGPSNGYGQSAAAMDTNGDSRMDVVIGDPTQQLVWVYDAGPKANPPAQHAYGEICPTSKGRLPRASHSLDPRVGRSGALYLDSAPPSTTTFLSVGLRRGTPLSLNFIRMTGCYSHVVPVVELGGIPTNGAGRVVVPSNLPNNASLVGSRAWFQWYPVDFGLPSSRLQVTASNGYEVKIGAR